jgi:hypothetical protein
MEVKRAVESNWSTGAESDETKDDIVLVGVGVLASVCAGTGVLARVGVLVSVGVRTGVLVLVSVGVGTVVLVLVRTNKPLFEGAE